MRYRLVKYFAATTFVLAAANFVPVDAGGGQAMAQNAAATQQPAHDAEACTDKMDQIFAVLSDTKPENLAAKLAELKKVVELCDKQLNATKKELAYMAQLQKAFETSAALEACRYKALHVRKLLKDRSEGKGRGTNELSIKRARFGDVENEDDWDIHEHTCNATWFFENNCFGDKSSTKPTSGASSSVAGPAGKPTYCIVSRTGATLGQGTDICGYDPSPQGEKFIEVEYNCAGEMDVRHVKVPAESAKIHLICQYPPPAPVTEDPRLTMEYFKQDPCKISLSANTDNQTPAPANVPTQ